MADESDNRKAIRRGLLVGLPALLLSRPALATAFQPTERDFLGPFFIEDAPWTQTLNRGGKPGPEVRVTGRLRAAGDGSPLADATLEIWQADGAGRYHPPTSGKAPDFDDDALDLRGRLRADRNGGYAFQTVVPGFYGTRPRHWHLRLSHPGFRSLVTQLYVTGDEPRGRQAGAPARHAALVADGRGFSYQAPDIFLAPT